MHTHTHKQGRGRLSFWFPQNNFMLTGNAVCVCGNFQLKEPHFLPHLACHQSCQLIGRYGLPHSPNSAHPALVRGAASHPARLPDGAAAAHRLPPAGPQRGLPHAWRPGRRQPIPDLRQAPGGWVCAAVRTCVRLRSVHMSVARACDSSNSVFFHTVSSLSSVVSFWLLVLAADIPL